jgi:hypothetical protein
MSIENKQVESFQPEEKVVGLDEEDDNKYILLVSSDGCKGEVLLKYATISNLINTASEHDKNENTYELKEVKDGQTLKDIILYMNIRKGEPYKYEKIVKPLVKTLMKDILVDPATGAVDQMEVDYINAISPDRMRLYNLINAANYMGMQDLLEIGVCRLAALTRYKKAEDLERVFSPTGDHHDDDYVDPIESKYP